MEYISSNEAMAIWLEKVRELPAKPSAVTVAADDPVYGPFIRGLGYAQTTIFANESGQRDLMADMVNRVLPEGQSPADSLAAAAAAEQALLDEYYK
jgi:multiple sugar transport system substrate-binding protein